MKKIFTFFLLSAFAIPVFSQVYENNWINYSQQYYKVKVSQEGIHRISQSALLFSGIPITAINHRKLQIWHNGEEQYIYVYDQNQNDTINGNDFIEFYADKNDGTFDTQLYQDPQWQPNPNNSLYNDTAVYFLTWNNSLSNRRFTESNDTSYSSFTPASYFIKHSYLEDKNTYIAGRTNSYGGTDIDFIEAEGWMGPRSSNINKTINTQNVFSGGPNVDVKTSIAGSNNNLHNLQIQGPGINFTDIFSSYAMRHYTFSISPSSITSSTSNFIYNSDNIAFANLSVIYPHTYDLENASSFKMYVPDDASQSKTRMDITNLNLSGSPILYDLTNHKRITVTQSSGLLQALVDNDGSTDNKVCYITGSSSVIAVGGLKAVNYVTNLPGQFNNFLSMQKDSAFLIITHRSLWNEAGIYKSYRDQTTNSKTVMVDIDELYDQFAYGIVKHPLSIKNFVKFILGNWTGVKPEHLFILGKSIQATSFRNSPSSFAACLIPAFGYPAADIPLTSGLSGNLFEPAIATGRLPATKGSQVLDYLAKVQEYEDAQNNPPQKWMKEILHFVGGSSSGQQNILLTYMNNYKSFLEDTLFGGNITTYTKNSSAPIIINQSDSLQARIDSGVALMTFFGHASGSGFDVSTDVPSTFNNRGRYHMVVANSCFAGDIHTQIPSVSEQFVMEPYKGAIGFIASVGLGESYYLDKYSSELFKNISYKLYGQSIGKVMKQSIAAIEDSNDLGIKTVCYEMSLDGDPALKVNNFSKPDLEISEPSISFSPSSITSETDTFSIRVVTRNIGRATADSFHVSIKRIYPDGTDSTYVITRNGCYFADTLSLTLHNGGFNESGLNLFSVEVDLDSNMVDEIDDFGNNSASTILFINSSDIVPVYPYKYAIVPANNVTFKANTSDPFAGFKNYRFELDTSDFSMPGYTQSPLYRYSSISGGGGILSWSNTITLLDSTVYFWRVANDSVQFDPVKYKWNESSFIYIPGKSGWSQAHFHQFKEDAYENVKYDSIGRKFNFVNNNSSLTAVTFGSPNPGQYNSVGYFLNNSVGEYNGCGLNAAAMVAVIDSITLEPWNTLDHPNSGSFNYFDGVSANCRFRPENYFIYRFDNSCPNCIDSMASFLDQVPNGNYILVYNWFTTTYSAYPNFINGLTNIGFTNAAVMPDTVPYIFFMKKGSPSSVRQLIGNDRTDSLRLNDLLTSFWDRGSASSVLVGPTTNWTSLHWQQHSLENNPSRDSIALNIFGIRNNGTLDTLLLGLTPSTSDTSLSWISASQYPYLQLQAFLKDDSLRTPPQLDKWQIYFDDVPEAALNANRLFNFHDDQLNEGDTMMMKIAIDNIGNLPMDSMLVDFYLYDRNRIRHNLKSVILDSLRVGQYLVADIRIDTTFGLYGQNSLWIDANPFGPDHQLEKYHFNNLAEIKFNVERDIINPILDVTFDGVHILNGDIVSGRPAITIQLHDENKFLALNDTSKFKVYLKSPSTATIERIYFSTIAYGATPQFTPAILPNNSCRIDFNPNLLEDGTYELQVEAADISNNESGKYNYRIQFEVINKSTITEVLNYPNPFSTSTRFVFTLTGNEIPSYMKIQIVSVSGKIVREITKGELGDIHIGRNITEYAWDGKDEFGDQLANGIYLYRVITNINGESIEKRNTDADKYFKKGWGKMYLMR